MDLDRGTLPRIERKLLAGLGQDKTYRMVRVPATASKWATWKRYCDLAGISMWPCDRHADRPGTGEWVGYPTSDDPAVFAERAEEEMTRHQEQVARREEKAAGAKDRLWAWNTHLRRWESELEARQRRVESAAKMSAQPSEAVTKVGRNERRPCGSGLNKYKHCHGLPGR